MQPKQFGLPAQGEVFFSLNIPFYRTSGLPAQDTKLSADSSMNAACPKSGRVRRDSYSARSASDGDILLARRAGMNAATSVEKLSVRMARRVAAGSY